MTFTSSIKLSPKTRVAF